MSLLTIRATIKPDAVSEVESAARDLFTAIGTLSPPNLRYGSVRLADGVTFLIMLQVEDGTENPLPQLPEFQRFQQGLRAWSAGPPDVSAADVVGSYQLF